MAGKPLDEVSLLNQRWGRDGAGLRELSGTGTVFAHLLETAVYS